MDTLLQDLQYAFRSLRKRPQFAFISVLTLAVGIGATSAIFSVFNAALLQPLPFPDPERIVRVDLKPPGERDARGPMVWSYPKFEVLRRDQRVFSELAGFSAWAYTLAGGGDPERVDGELVTGDYFALLGVRPRAGRWFASDELRDPGRAQVALIGEGLWNRRWNADPSLIGRAVTLDGKPTIVVGIVPAGFGGLTGRAEIWMPIAATGAENLAEKWSHFFTVVARIAPGTTLERAQAATALLGQTVDREIPDPQPRGGWSAAFVPFEQIRIDPAIRRAVIIVFGAVTVLLLIACANVANLLLARAADRRREIAVRLAIGAGRGRLVRQLITEALVLAGIGGAIGLLVGSWCTRLIGMYAGASSNAVVRQLSGLSAVSLAEIRVSAPVVLFSTVAIALTGVLFGLVPALQASRANLTVDLKHGGRGMLGIHGIQALAGRSLLVTIEIALAFVLLVGSGLMLRSLARLLDTEIGVDPANLLTARVTLPESYTPEQVTAFWDQLLQRTSGLPGVQTASITDCPPLAGGCNGTLMWFTDRPEAPQNEQLNVGVHWVTPDYFNTVRVPVVRGRGFAATDRSDAPRVVLINETAAQKYFPGEDPIGRRIGVGQGGFGAGDGALVIGVVADQRFDTVEAPPIPDVYISYLQSMRRRGMLFIRTSGEPMELITPIRSAVGELDPNLPLYDVLSMDQRVANVTARTRITGLVLTMFAGTALLLALVGVYGVLAYAVAQRTRELGVRMALGALRSDVVGLVLRHSARMVALGLALGIACALAATRTLRALLYEIQPSDPLTFVVLAALTAVIAFAASAAPALRAARIDPLVALKSE